VDEALWWSRLLASPKGKINGQKVDLTLFNIIFNSFFYKLFVNILIMQNYVSLLNRSRDIESLTCATIVDLL